MGQQVEILRRQVGHVATGKEGRASHGPLGDEGPAVVQAQLAVPLPAFSAEERIHAFRDIAVLRFRAHRLQFAKGNHVEVDPESRFGIVRPEKPGIEGPANGILVVPDVLGYPQHVAAPVGGHHFRSTVAAGRKAEHDRTAALPDGLRDRFHLVRESGDVIILDKIDAPLRQLGNHRIVVGLGARPGHVHPVVVVAPVADGGGVGDLVGGVIRSRYREFELNRLARNAAHHVDAEPQPLGMDGIDQFPETIRKIALRGQRPANCVEIDVQCMLCLRRRQVRSLLELVFTVPADIHDEILVPVGGQKPLKGFQLFKGRRLVQVTAKTVETVPSGWWISEKLVHPLGSIQG